MTKTLGSTPHPTTKNFAHFIQSCLLHSALYFFGHIIRWCYITNNSYKNSSRKHKIKSTCDKVYAYKQKGMLLLKISFSNTKGVVAGCPSELQA